MLKSRSTRYPFTRDWVQVKDQQTGGAIWHDTKFCGLNKLALVDDPQGESKLPEPLGDLKRDMPPAWLLSCIPQRRKLKPCFRQVGLHRPRKFQLKLRWSWTGLVLYLEGNPFLEHFLRQPERKLIIALFCVMQPQGLQR